VDHVYLADNVILLNVDGSLAFSGIPEDSNLIKAELSKIVPTEREDSGITDHSSNEENKQPISMPRSESNREKNDPTRQVGDFSVWWYYAKSIGAWRAIAAITIITINVVASNFPST
jgi:hypothetical protein